MCQGNPILRILGFAFLLVAFIAAGIGLIAPFWVRNTKAESDGKSLKEELTLAAEGELKKLSHDVKEMFVSSTTPTTRKTTKDDYGADNIEDEESLAQDPPEDRKKRQVPSDPVLVSIVTPQPTVNLLTSVNLSTPSDQDNFWYWEGLWAKCQSNLTCRCFAQDDFEMENEFQDWHKAAQGLFSLGFLVYFITILIGGFYLCCRCCKESIKLATTLGSFTITGIILIALGLVVYGGFSYGERGINFEGTDIVFEWGYLLSIASLGPAILAAIFYLIDGCRGTIVVEHDDCETAKMV